MRIPEKLRENQSASRARTNTGEKCEMGEFDMKHENMKRGRRGVGEPQWNETKHNEMNE